MKTARKPNPFELLFLPYARVLVGALVLVLVGALLAGCESPGPRAQFLTGVETAKLLYTASAQMYAKCHNDAAGNAAEQTRCYQEKNQRGAQIGEALPFLMAAKEVLITYEQVRADPNLQEAQRILRTMMPALRAFLTDGERHAVEWIEL